MVLHLKRSGVRFAAANEGERPAGVRHRGSCSRKRGSGDSGLPRKSFHHLEAGRDTVAFIERILLLPQQHALPVSLLVVPSLFGGGDALLCAKFRALQCEPLASNLSCDALEIELPRLERQSSSRQLPQVTA